MANSKIYRYVFEDGCVEICVKMTKNELAWEQIKHGKLVSMTVE